MPNGPRMALFCHMTDLCSGRFKMAKADAAGDLAEVPPAVSQYVVGEAPAVPAAMEGLRLGVPYMASAAPGEQGDLYRIRGHNRSVCIALSGDKSTSDVVVIKGSEP